MSNRQGQLFILERIKRYVAEGHLFAQSQSAIDIINEIIEQISKTETVVMKRAIPLINNNKEILKKEFAYHIANHIMENGYAEPKPRTNFDRIKSMSVEDFVNWVLFDVQKIATQYTQSTTGLAKWLQKECE